MVERRRDESEGPQSADRPADVGLEAVPGTAASSTPEASRGRPWRVALAGLVAFGLVGGGYAYGATVGARTSPPVAAPAVAAPEPSPQTVPSTTVDQPAQAQAPEVGSPPELALKAAGAAGAEDAAADEAYEGGWSTRTLFTLGDLSPAVESAPTTANGWGYDPTSVFTAETAARFAAAVGLEGTPVRTDWAWVVGSPDWTAASLNLGMDAFASVSFSDPAAEVPWCGVAADPPAPVDPECLVVVEAPPTVDVAITGLRTILEAAGVDTTDLDFQAVDSGTASYTTVAAHPRGTRAEEYSPGTWSATYTHLGLQWLWGSAAPAVDLGAYDILTPVDAFERLSDPRFAPMYWIDAPESLYSEPYVPPTAPPATPAAGAQIPWDVSTATITSWELITTFHYAEDGSALRLPTYRFGESTGFVWEVLAVADHHLAF